jgi:hypothetical protein
MLQEVANEEKFGISDDVKTDTIKNIEILAFLNDDVRNANIIGRPVCLYLPPNRPRNCQELTMGKVR